MSTLKRNVVAGNGLRTIEELLNYFENNASCFADHGFIDSYIDLMLTAPESVIMDYFESKFTVEHITSAGLIPANYCGMGSKGPLVFWHQRRLTLLLMLHPAIGRARVDSLRTKSSPPPAPAASEKEVEERSAAESLVLGTIIAGETGLNYSNCEQCYISTLCNMPVDPNCQQATVFANDPAEGAANNNVILVHCSYGALMLPRMRCANKACAEPGTVQEPLVAAKKCGRCKVAYYCSQECQREAWPRHKKFCKKK